MRVGFDHDGVLSDFGGSVRDTLILTGQGHLWPKDQLEPTQWNFYEKWDWDFDQFKALVDWGVDNGHIFTGHWREGAVEAMGDIAQMGHEVIVITDRFFGSVPENSHKNTIEAFQRAGIEYDELHFSADKTCVPLDMMVEDKWENFCKLTEAGVDTYLINRPWNEYGGYHPKRIDSVAEYADIVAKVTKQGWTDLAFV